MRSIPTETLICLVPLAALVAVMLLLDALRRQRDTEIAAGASAVESQIKYLAKSAMVEALAGFLLGVLALVAWSMSAKAIRLIRESGSGQEYVGKAKTARILAIIAASLWGCGLFSQLWNMIIQSA